MIRFTGSTNIRSVGYTVVNKKITRDTKPTDSPQDKPDKFRVGFVIGNSAIIRE